MTWWLALIWFDVIRCLEGCMSPGHSFQSFHPVLMDVWSRVQSCHVEIEGDGIWEMAFVMFTLWNIDFVVDCLYWRVLDGIQLSMRDSSHECLRVVATDARAHHSFIWKRKLSDIGSSVPCLHCTWSDVENILWHTIETELNHVLILGNYLIIIPPSHILASTSSHCNCAPSLYIDHAAGVYDWGLRCMPFRDIAFSQLRYSRYIYND